VRIVLAASVALGLCAISLAPPARSAPAAEAAQGAPIGAWRTTNGCFLVAFLLTEGGRAQAAYMTGEQEANAAWTWDGSTLKITSPTFDLDSFAGRLTNDRLEADYVWHDLDKDQLNRQACVFERFTPLGL
jgi:hypothetical protein